MKYALIILGAVIIIGAPFVAIKADINNEQMATPTCVTYPEWTGKNIDEIDMTVLGDRPRRILAPNSMATMDYSPDRLNIHTTEDGIILTQDCG